MGDENGADETPRYERQKMLERFVLDSFYVLGVTLVASVPVLGVWSLVGIVFLLQQRHYRRRLPCVVFMRPFGDRGADSFMLYTSLALAAHWRPVCLYERGRKSVSRAPRIPSLQSVGVGVPLSFVAVSMLAVFFSDGLSWQLLVWSWLGAIAWIHVASTKHVHASIVFALATGASVLAQVARSPVAPEFAFSIALLAAGALLVGIERRCPELAAWLRRLPTIADEQQLAVAVDEIVGERPPGRYTSSAPASLDEIVCDDALWERLVESCVLRCKLVALDVTGLSLKPSLQYELDLCRGSGVAVVLTCSNADDASAQMACEHLGRPIDYFWDPADPMNAFEVHERTRKLVELLFDRARYAQAHGLLPATSRSRTRR